MINIGDRVKVIKPTEYMGKPKELFSIGTICQVIDIKETDGVLDFEIVPIDELSNSNPCGFWYLEDELEKGHIEWVKDE